MNTLFQPSALSGLKVLELDQLIAGPFAAKTLADFSQLARDADVLIEHSLTPTDSKVALIVGLSHPMPLDD